MHAPLSYSPLPSIYLTSKYAWAGRGVRLLTTVQVVNDANIILFVRAREANCRWCLVCRATHDVDLRALHVELRAHAGARRVQGDELATEEVLAWSNTGWDFHGLHAFVGDQSVNAPF
jgi:hypothetical protein